MQLGAAGAALLLPGREGSKKDGGFELAEWTGDDFALMHAIRDERWNRSLPPPERKVEVAVAGGGLAALAIATMLSDLDLILLKREAQAGGNARGGAGAARPWVGFADPEVRPVIGTFAGVSRLRGANPSPTTKSIE